MGTGFPVACRFQSCDIRTEFESWLERDHLMMLDFSPVVRSFAAQPFWLSWSASGKTRRHVPDFFVRQADGRGVVVDVRPDKRIKPIDAEAFAATAAACESVGWGYRRVGELDPVLAANVRWLAGYRHARCLREEHRALLVEAFARPAPLMTTLEAVGDRIAVLPSLFPPDVDRGPGHGLDDSAIDWILAGPHRRSPAMTVSRPPELRVGDEIVVDGATHTVAGLSGSQAQLVDVIGTESRIALADLLGAPGFRMVARSAAPLPPQGLMDSLPADIAEHARWWERHVVEVIRGIPPESSRAARPRPEYDPATRTLRQREMAKVSELAATGHAVPLSTLQRLRLSYEKQGVWGLVDHRAARRPGARTDERVLAAISQAVAEETNRSTGTVARLRRRVEQILTTEHGIDPASVMPARATFYRLAERVSAGRHTFGSARTRRSLAQRPDGPFCGRLMQLRSVEDSWRSS